MTRPKRGECLWVRLHLKGGLEIEGTMPNNILAMKPWESIRILTDHEMSGYPVWATFMAEFIESCEVLGVCGTQKLIKDSQPTARGLSLKSGGGCNLNRTWGVRYPTLKTPFRLVRHSFGGAE